MSETREIHADTLQEATLITGRRESTSVPLPLGLSVTYPPTESSVWPSARIDQAVIGGPFKTGLQLANCWNATLTDCYVHGPLGDEAEYANPRAMQTGIDVLGSMDAHLIRPRITCAGIGIHARSDVDASPRSEGLHVEGGWLMHVNVGVQLTGSILGGWPTPWSVISGVHIAYNIHAVFAQQQSWMHLDRLNCYASHYKRSGWAIYLVGCTKVTISACDVWSNWPTAGFLGGILLDACEDVTITDGAFSDNISLALHATSRCRRVRTNGKVWEDLARQGKVINQAAP